MPNRGNRMEAVFERDDQQVEIGPNESKCCVPLGCNLGEVVHLDDLSECVKVICNNEQCQEGRYMHKECFDLWEETVLTFLRSTGRARSWSEKQRLQNLWTKKGYDLAYKACGCRCGKGHLKKDLDWIAPPVSSKDDRKKKKKNRKRGNDKPSLIISTSMNATNGSVGRHANGNTNTSNGNSNGNGHGTVIPITRMRTSSMSSTGSVGSGGTTPPMSASESQSPGFSDANFACWQKFMFGNQQQPRRERSNSGSIFSRRHDYSSFNNLPRHKINSYNIKMEDDVNHGNDETRCFLLSTFSANHTNRVPCILCHDEITIFDRYPLIDGSFFLSPRQHSKSAVPVQVDGTRQYLNAVCMQCLQGWKLTLRCKNCDTKWNGSHLILGSMYSYDIFAAVPCCAERLLCNNCNRLVIPPDTRLQYFSDYSHLLPCGHCGILDHHFVKPLQVTYVRSD